MSAEQSYFAGNRFHDVYVLTCRVRLDGFTLIQDGGPSHTARGTRELLAP